MNSLTYPSVYDSASVSNYFNEFVKLNESKDFFSFRYFAGKIRWPVGYLNDLMKGRRSLTLARCMQFLEFSGMDPIASERFLLLCFKDNLDEKQRLLVDSKMPKSRGTKRFDDLKQLEANRQQTVLIVFDLLCWAKKLLVPDEIIALAPIFALKTQEVENAIQLLLKNKIVEVGPGSALNILVPTLMLDELLSQNPETQILKLHQDFAKTSLAYYDYFQGPAALNGGFVEIPRARFQEFFDKFLAFRNWLFEYSREVGQHAGRKRLDENLVFQFDINLFPIIDKKVAKMFSDKQEGEKPGANPRA